MATRKGEAIWQGNLHDGKGSIKATSGAFELPYSLGSRVESAPGTSPEELLAAAHAGCFTMAFAAMLSDRGIGIKTLKSSAQVRVEPIQGGLSIASIALSTEADLKGCDDATFQALARQAKEHCAVGKALTGVTVTLEATLLPSG